MYYKAPNNSLHFIDDKAFEHLLPEGSILITDEEAEALRPVPPPPTPLEQIRAKEQAQNVRDAMERANRLAALVIARTELVRQQAAKGATVTHDQAHAFLYANDKAYKLLWDVEQEVAPLRKLIP